MKEKEREELAYRRGYSHGFEAGIMAAARDIKDVKKIRFKISEWRDDLDITSGGPGSFGETLTMYHEKDD